MNPRRHQELFPGSPWFTPVDVPDLEPRIEPSSVLYFAGSCFAENLYRVWTDHFLPGELSPFGSTYNPVSLAATMGKLGRGDKIHEDEIFYHKGLWRHSLFNTLASRPEKSDFLNHINSELNGHREALKSASVLVLTLGTAFVYRDMAPPVPGRTAGEIVNNCHQRPAAEFKRSALNVDEIVKALEDLKDSLNGLNPSCSLILTLSPVRHMRDGAAENSLSKSLLRCGIQEYLERDGSASYFPSYEILLDELRDYRWYAPDLCHPSAEAAAYITNRFFQSAGSPEFHSYQAEARKLKALLDHKIRFPESDEAGAFLEKRESALHNFLKRYPFARLPSADKD